MRLATIAAVAGTGLMPMRAVSPTQPLVPSKSAGDAAGTEIRFEQPDAASVHGLPSSTSAPSLAVVNQHELAIRLARLVAESAQLESARARLDSGKYVIRGYACNAGGVIEDKILRVNPVIVPIDAGGAGSPADSTPNP